VFFGNPRFNNGEPQDSLPPQLNYLSFQDQQSARANRRLDVAYGADNVFAWFLPNRGGDHDLKFGVNYLYSSLRVQDFSNMNGTFTLNTDLPFDASNPRTYPERLSIRVPGALDFYMKGHFIGLFAQDKWKITNNFTLNLGVRYDVEVLPTPNQNNPLFADDPDGYPRDTNNISPRLGFSWALDEAGRSAIRGGMGVFYQRTSYTFLTNMFGAGARFSTSFTAQFPTNNIDPGPRQGQFPTDPRLVNGPEVNRALIDSLFPPGTLVRNGGTVRFDNPDRQNAFSRQYSIGYERQLGTSMGLSVDFIRSEQRNQYVLMDLNPLLRDGTLATQTKGGRNGARGPSYQQFDIGAGYRIRLGGGRTLDAFLDIFNLTNRANFANPAGDQRLPATFLRLVEVSDEGPTRTAQLNFRYGF
jgi:outer membrane receptor protein involved in Fe transport